MFVPFVKMMRRLGSFFPEMLGALLFTGKIFTRDIFDLSWYSAK